MAARPSASIELAPLPSIATVAVLAEREAFAPKLELRDTPHQAFDPALR